MTTTTPPPSPSNLRPRRRTPPATVLQSGTRHQSPGRPHQLPTVPRPTQSTSSWLSPSQPGQPGPRELAARSGPLGPLGPQGHQVTDQAYPSPLLQAHQTPAPSNLPSGQPVLPLPTPASQPPAPSNLTSGCPGQPVLPQPGHRTASLTRPSSRLFTDTDISSVAYKTPCNFYREGTILPVFVPCLYLCHACIYGTACICTTCRYKYPRHPLGGTGDIS